MLQMLLQKLLNYVNYICKQPDLMIGLSYTVRIVYFCAKIKKLEILHSQNGT